nr:hypothetical protein [Tanacetum cinerariifolium]
VENLIPIPSESEGIPEHVCDMPSIDNSPPLDASPLDSELVSSEVMEIVIPEVGGIKASNDNPIPSYDPIISGTPPNLTTFGENLDLEGDMLLFESFLNDDPFSESQTKSSSTSLNSLLEETNNFHNSLPEYEFARELTLLKSIPPGSDETDCDFEEDIRLIKKLLYDNSSPRPPEEFVSANSDAATESFSPSPILVKD